MSVEEKTALFVGRFQPFHNGHMETVRRILDETAHVIIGIGSSQYGFKARNPFTYDERCSMINDSLIRLEGCTDRRWSMVPVPDIHCLPLWVRHVKRCVPDFDVVYSGNENTIKLFGKAGYEVIAIVRDEPGISGSLVRTMMSKSFEGGDDRWCSMVPAGTFYICRKIRGCKRIYHLNMSDYHVPDDFCDWVRETVFDIE
jgi:nicotinamide-nucleotide adenylyltransferase